MYIGPIKDFPPVSVYQNAPKQEEASNEQAVILLYVSMRPVFLLFEENWPVRAVPEIILGGAFFFTLLHPQDKHGVRASPPTPRTRKCFN